MNRELFPDANSVLESQEFSRHKKKEFIKKKSIEYLDKFDIRYTSKNNGLHFLIPYSDSVIDFWPTTQKWWDKDLETRGIGIISFLQYIGELEPDGEK